jgi:membrane-bound lytic murein transglycosylase B
MSKLLTLPAILLTVFAACHAPVSLADDDGATGSAASSQSFQDWLAAFRKQAAAAGISEATLDATLTGLQPDPRIIRYDQRQPEFVQTFWNYLDVMVNDKRVAAGKAMLSQYGDLFSAAEQRYGVPARYLAAFWGLETNYGNLTGDIAIIPALATLAYDARRSQFFRVQLLNALRIVDSGNMPASDLRGSWAGAFGQMQFMPSTYLRYAVDGDGDGRINIRSSIADAIDSAANYLRQAGWQPGQDWGEEVRLPKDFDWGLARLDRWKTLRDWHGLGVTRADGSPLPEDNHTAAILLPQGHSGPAVMIDQNFNVILRWNRSVNYAIAVGLLADRLADKPALVNGREVDNRRLSREQVIDMQNLLAGLGFDPGPVDGMPGRRTLNAIRAYQAAFGLPADGYASVDLLERLHTKTTTKQLPTSAGPAAPPREAL